MTDKDKPITRENLPSYNSLINNIGQVLEKEEKMLLKFLIIF